MCDNTWDSSVEPKDDDVCHGGTVSWGVFYNMMKPSLNGIAEDDMLAILKRTVVIIAGYRAVYMRMPSEKKDEPIQILTLNDVASNWFQQDKMWAYASWQQGNTTYPSGYAEAKTAEREFFRHLLEKKTKEDKAEEVTNILKKKWSKEWNGSQPEGLVNSTGEHVDPPGWYPLIEPRIRDELFQFTVQSIQRYRGLTTDVLKDMSTKFVIDELSAFNLIRYFAAPAADSLTTQGAGVESLEGCLEEWVAEGLVAEGWVSEDPATPRNEKRVREDMSGNSPEMKRSS